MIDGVIFKSIYRRAIFRADGLCCCFGGMIFSTSNMLNSFCMERHAAYRPSAGAHSMTIMSVIQRLAWMGKNNFELLASPNSFR